MHDSGPQRRAESSLFGDRLFRIDASKGPPATLAQTTALKRARCAPSTRHLAQRRTPLNPYTRRAPPGERKKNFMPKSSPPDLGVFLRAVHLGLAIMLGLASLPFFAAAVYGWWTADQFSGFANYEQLMMTTARDALTKGAICAAGAIWLLVLWRSQHNARRRG